MGRLRICSLSSSRLNHSLHQGSEQIWKDGAGEDRRRFVFRLSTNWVQILNAPWGFDIVGWDGFFKDSLMEL